MRLIRAKKHKNMSAVEYRIKKVRKRYKIQEKGKHRWVNVRFTTIRNWFTTEKEAKIFLEFVKSDINSFRAFALYRLMKLGSGVKKSDEKALSLSDVVGQSEQLFCIKCGNKLILTRHTHECTNCGYKWAK